MKSRERVAAMRAALAERQEREARLPRAICRICGGWAATGTGERSEPSPWEDARQRQEREVMAERMPADVDGWRRTCVTCAAVNAADLASYLLRGALDIDADSTDATRTLRDLATWNPTAMRFESPFRLAEEADARSGERWGHFSPAERGALRSRVLGLLASYRREREPGPSVQGGCALCGRRQALIWHASPLQWQDGSPAPLCRDCNTVWEARGQPHDIAGIRRVAVEAATGWPVPLGAEAPAAFRAFFEHRAADPEGRDEPWAYSDGLAAYREQVWEAYPECAPEDRRAEFTQRRAQRYAEMAAEQMRQREKQDADAW
ncbi:hypothetical protein ACIQLJ_08500 [Microbacterium sp. NPDC091313]